MSGDGGSRTALPAGVAVLERAISYTLGSIALVTPPMLARRTPCTHWTLRDLLAHLGDSMDALLEAAETGRVALAPAAGPDAVVPMVRERAVRLLGAWANAGADLSVRIQDAPLTAPVIAAAGAVEVTVHGWDVAQACGRPRPIPADLAAELLDLSVLLVRPADRPGCFGRPVPVPGDSPAGARLLAFLGRTP